MDRHGVDPTELLQRHARGDWGDLAPEDERVNDLAVRQGLSILSAYRVGEQCVWIVTEPDRQTTWLLLRHEY